MIKERIIEGRRCRDNKLGNDHFGGPIWIADTGDYAAYSDGNGGVYCQCRIFCDIGGPFLIDRRSDRDYEKIYLETLVMSCFGDPDLVFELQRSWPLLMINHRDGNWMNCDYRNLEKAPYHYRNATSDRVGLYKSGAFLEVLSNGTIWVDGVELPILDWGYGSPLPFIEEEYHIVDPFVIINGVRTRVEEIMENAGYIQGDDADLKEPRILHRDGNYLNFASDNLEWVKKRDPRYDYYLQFEKDAKQDKAILLNKGKYLPDWLM